MFHFKGKGSRSHQAGLAFGGFLGGFHLIWGAFVALGIAQPLLDLVFQLHMIQPPYVVQPFSIALTAGLVAFTSAFGYAIGYVLCLVWEAVQTKS